MSLVGTKLGDYRVLEELGRGGQARVYKAFQRSQRRVVALKVLDINGADKTQLALFQNEAKYAPLLRDPHIVSSFDTGAQDGVLYMAMELLQGRTLEQYLMGGRQLAVSEVLLMLAQLASALNYMHENDIIHGDLKPSNIFLVASSLAHIKLLDFGCSRRIGETGECVGTPYYASPEQFKNETLDQRTDVYSLGILLYEVLGGQLPTGVLWSRSSLNSTPINEPIRLTGLNTTVSADLDEVVRKSLCKDVTRRFDSVTTLFRAFARAAYGTPGNHSSPIEGPSMNCPQCGHSNLPGSAFCDNCGFDLNQATAPAVGGITCPQCGTLTPLGAAFCDNCGANLTASPVQAPIFYPLPISRPTYPPAPPAQPPVQRMMRMRLVVSSSGVQLPLAGKQEFYIGRDDPFVNFFPDVDLTPHSDALGVSRRHARIAVYGNQVLFDDLNSTNGSFVNGVNVQPGHPAPLTDGAEIRLGKVVLTFHTS